MSVSKYKPKVALGGSDEVLTFKSRAEIERYVKKINPYRTRSGGAVKGVVAEVVNFLTYSADGTGLKVTSSDADEYFRNFIPNSYQQSGEYISEMVSLWQTEHGLSHKSVTQEELTFIRAGLKKKIETSRLEKLVIPKSDARTKDNSLRASLKGAYEHEDGSVTVNVWMYKGKLGRRIGELWEKAQTSRIKDQFKPERLRETLKGIANVDDKLIDYISKHGVELATINGKPLTKRMVDRKIWDMSAEIKSIVRQVFNPVVVKLCGEHLTFADLESAFLDKADNLYGGWGEGNKVRDRISNFFQRFKLRLWKQTPAKVFPLVLKAILDQMGSLSAEDWNKTLDTIYDNKLLPEKSFDYYDAEAVSDWVLKVLREFSVDEETIGAIQSVAFEEVGDLSMLEQFGATPIFEYERQPNLSEEQLIEFAKEFAIDSEGGTE